MLTGALAPTEGYALVAGKDIRTQIGQIRQDLGICLQVGLGNLVTAAKANETAVSSSFIF